MGWINLFQFLVSTLSLLLGLYLLRNNRIIALTVYFLILSAHNGARMVMAIEEIPVPDFVQALRFVYTPLVFFAIHELLYKDFRYSKIHLLHLIPVTLAGTLPLVSGFPDRYVGMVGGPVTVAYLIASYYCVFEFKRAFEVNRASGAPDSVIWLLRTLHGYSLLIVFELARQFVGPELPAELYEQLHLLFVAFVSICLIVLVYQGLISENIFLAVNKEELELTKNLDEPRTRHVSQDHPQLLIDLVNYMAKEKPFIDSHITIKELAKQMGVPTRALSELINDEFNCNFSEYINRARVTEAQALMANPEWSNKTLLDIGLASGFNSKTSFNVMFKRITSLTPSAYRKECSSSNMHSQESLS